MSNKTVLVKAVRNDGEVFNYHDSDWGIISLEGVDFPVIEIFKSNRGYGNGSIITGKRKQSRQINIKAQEQNKLNNAEDRARAIGFHNSNYTFDLHITYMGVTRIAKDCQLEAASLPNDNVWKRLNLTVSYLHPESDLLGENSESTNFTDTDPLWHVTRAYSPGGGTLAFGVINHTTSKIINYLGSEDTYIHVRVEATGLVEGMNIEINGVKMHVEVTMTEGDLLNIDSETKTVRLNGEDVAPALYDGEQLPKLILTYGDNTVKVEADDEGNTAYGADLIYVGRYGGL
jgi:hypothetical protein